MQLWRTELPAGSGESPYRLGVVVDGSAAARDDEELTAAWLKGKLKELKLDHAVTSTADAGRITATTIGTTGERPTPSALQLAGGILRVWKTAAERPRGSQPQAGPDPDVSRYWEQLGVDALWGDIDACMAGVERAAEGKA